MMPLNWRSAIKPIQKDAEPVDLSDLQLLCLLDASVETADPPYRHLLAELVKRAMVVESIDLVLAQEPGT